MSERLPGLRPQDAVRALEKAGLRVVRTTGGHIILYREGLPRPIPIPRHGGDLKRRLLADIVKQAGLTVEQFLAYLRD